MSSFVYTEFKVGNSLKKVYTNYLTFKKKKKIVSSGSNKLFENKEKYFLNELQFHKIPSRYKSITHWSCLLCEVVTVVNNYFYTILISHIPIDGSHVSNAFRPVFSVMLKLDIWTILTGSGVRVLSIVIWTGVSVV